MLKKFHKNDTNFLLNLRNSSEVRESSISKKKIYIKDHINWLNKIRRRRNYYIFIIIEKKKRAGYIRLENKKNEAIVSIAILKKYRNKGIGKFALRQAEIKSRFKQFKAYVYRENSSSIKLFKSLNYFKTGVKQKFIIMKKKQKNYKTHLKIIDNIKKIRTKNNSNWMDILKIAFKYAPNESSKIMSEIYKDDKKISTLAKKLSKNI
tara:strand:- start:141 stop:761 length:621 start_codon:yes stop_codon:yes gene_type:complete